MKDIDYVMYMLYLEELEKKKKNEENVRKKNRRSEEQKEGKKEKDQQGSSEEPLLDEKKKKDINEQAATPGAAKGKVSDNAGIGVSSGTKSVEESADEPAKEDVGTSGQQNDDIAQIPSQAKRQRLANEDFEASHDQQNDVAQGKRQKME